MGCKYSYICDGYCPGCIEYEPELYVGEAEDTYNKTHGRVA